MSKSKPRIAEDEVQITRPEKVLFPDDGITKRDLVDYYKHVSPWILPHLKDRPLTLERFPDGIGALRIIQKSTPAYFPAWIRTVTVKKAGGTVMHAVCDDENSLAYIANQACITPHIWLSRASHLNYPDQIVFDLDPPGDASGESFVHTKAIARALGEVLDDMELPAYLKTSGSRGLHIAVPLKPESDFDKVRAVARQIAESVVARNPEVSTLEQRKSERRGRVFIDINRNAYAQTIAPVYAVRPRRGAPVSWPMDWRDLERKDLRPDGVTIREVLQRLDRAKDPWKNFWKDAVSLKKFDFKSGERHAA